MALATDGIGGLAAVGEGASSVLSKAPAETSELLAGAATSAAAKLTKKDDDDDINESPTKDDADAAGGWLSSIAGTKRPAAREARGAPEAKTGEAPAGPDAGARSSD